MPIPGASRLKWQFDRFVILLVGIAVLLISFANFLVIFFDFKRKGFWRNWRWWLSGISWFGLLMFARQLIHYWKTY